MKLELVPRLAQQQILSPKMLLSMKVLPLTTMELERQLSQEVAENPALEMVSDAQELPEIVRKLDTFSTSLRLFQPYQDSGSRGRARRSDEDDLFADLPARTNGLAEHLEEQVAMMDLAPAVRETVGEIIGNLDWKGYLLFPREELAESLPERLAPCFEEALGVVRSLDPVGIGAEDLRECLLLQLRGFGGGTSVAERIVRDHFDLLINNRIPQLAAALQLPVPTVTEELAAIGELSTRPGAPFLREDPPAIRPDVVIEEGEQGYRVQVQNEGVPRLQLSEACRQLLAGDGLDGDVAAYLKKKIESAQWLLQALDGRKRTLKDIAEAVMDFQRGFLQTGPSHLVPLTMQTVAEAVGVHVSTVSRAVKGKYIQTPWGTYPLRHFFDGGVPDGDGELTSRKMLKDKITEIIQKEDKSAPLSDGDLAAKLRAQGFRISRRTVSKYRLSANIPPANLRKVY